MVADVIKASCTGYHGTVACYGQVRHTRLSRQPVLCHRQCLSEVLTNSVARRSQSGSGKTFSMMGNKEHPGIIPQALRQVFDHVASASADRRFLIRCSYVEIYREVTRSTRMR